MPPSSLRIDQRLSIPLTEIELRAVRSSGPGGQHANVTASRIEAVFDIEASASLTPAQRERLQRRYGRRVVAIAQDSRGQARNRELALERLAAKIEAGIAVPKSRRKTRPTRASGERRLAGKRRRADIKRGRRRPTGDE